MLKKICVAVLALMFVISCASCKDNNRSDSSEPGGSELKTTGELIVDDGNSDYSIIISENATSRESYAAEELKLFASKTSGVSLEVKSDSGLNYSADKKYLCIGKTALNPSDFLLTYDELGSDGFKIKTVGKSVFMSGYGGDGTLFAVYEFLAFTFGVEFYAEDEILLPSLNKAELYDFDIVSVPDFEERALGYLATQGNSKNALRMRLGEGTGNWGLWAHTHFKIINYDLPSGQTYLTSHPEWFSSDGTQLCLTNEDMQAKFTENLKTIIEDLPDAEYFMLGQEDYNTFCDCNACAESNAQNGGESGTAMIFINSVARKIKAWLNETAPERNVTLVTFAYCKTEEAPVNYDESNGTFSAVNDKVVAEENVGVMFAPIYACYSHSILDNNCNSLSRNALLGWSKVSSKLLVWTYSSNYAAYLQPFNNYSSLKANFDAYKDNGVIYVYEQGIYNSYDSFHDLRVYVHSKMLWDSDSNVLQLEKDFIEQYYKDAAGKITEYYELIKSHYMSLEQDGNDSNNPYHTYCTWNYGVLNLTAALWSKEFLNRCLKIFDEAYEIIDKIEDSSVRETVRVRTVRESLYARYMMLELYSVYYSTAQKKEMIDSFESDAYLCSVTRYKSADGIVGGPDLSKKITEWREGLL